MRRNTSGQVIGAQMVSASDGSAFTGSVTCYVTGDGGTQAVGSVSSGAATHEGNGFHTYAPAQAETDYAHIAFTFTGTGAVPVTVQVYPTFPQTGDAFARLGAPAGASIAADIATVDTVVDAILVDTGTSGVLISSGTGTGQLSLSSGEVTPTAASKTGYRLSATGVDDIWDEGLSGHVAAGSAGAALYIIRSATAQAGSGTTITLDSGASAVDDFYNNQAIYIVSGTGAGQGRIISDYVGSTRVATVASWVTNPSSDSVFVIRPFGSIPGATAPTAGEVADAVWDEAMSAHVSEGSFGSRFQAFHVGTAQAGGASTITLDASGSSSTTDFYRYAVVEIISGTGAGQSRQITAYNGTSKVATVDPAWTTQPTSDSNYVVKGLGIDAATTGQIADAVWDEARAGHVAAGSFGEYVLADSVRVSGSSTAADGLEAAVAGSTPLPANTVMLSGDTVAADNAEAFFDGTGYAGTNNVIPTVTNVGTVTGNVNGSVGSVTGAVGSVTGAVGSVTGNVGGTINGLTSTAREHVNAEVVDALITDTYAEPSAVPAATSSIKDKINWLFALARNKVTSTATTQTLRNDADSGNISTSSQSDDGTTFTRNEWS